MVRTDRRRVEDGYVRRLQAAAIDQGDPLEGYGDQRGVPLPAPRLRGGSGAGAETQRIPVRVWIAIVVAVPAIVVFVILRRRRAGEEDA